MKTLLTSFNDLCTTVQDKINNAHADKCKSVVLDHLRNLPSNAQAHHMKQMEQKHSVEDMLSTLINSGFCSYLDYKPLPAVIACYDDMEELGLLLKAYEKENKTFCKETTLMELVQTFTDHSELQPVVSVGTPSLVFQLSNPWPNLRLHTATTTLCSVLPWVSQLQLQAVEGGDHITLVYCGFKLALTSLVGDLQKPDTARILQELGISVKQQMDYNPIAQV